MLGEKLIIKLRKVNKMASMHKSEEDSDVIYDLTSDFKAIGPLTMNFVRIQNM